MSAALMDEAEEHNGFGRFLGLTVLGAVLPGAGLVATGRHIRGGILMTLAVVAAVTTAVVVYVMGPTATALYLGVRPNLLIALVTAAVIALLALVVSVIHTAAITWPSRPQTGRRALAMLVTILLVLGILAPTVPAVQYVLIHRDLVSSLFTHTAFNRGNAVSPVGGGQDAWRNAPRVNVMLIGSDAYPGRPGIRTDSMMVASIDTKTGNTVLFGVPRNLENVPLGPGSPLTRIHPNGYDCGDSCLMNEVWNEGTTHADLFPGDPMPGLTATRLALSEVLGIGIDYAVVVDIRGFSSFVDAMGGVDVNVRNRIPIGGKVKNGRIVSGSINGWIEAGPQHLNGYEAMWFSRSRATTDDFDRMARQRCMVGALVRQADPPALLERYPQLAQVAKEHVYTDVPPEHLAAWAQLLTRMQEGKIRSLPFTSKIIDVTDPDYDRIHTIVQDALSPDPVEGTPAPASTPTPFRYETVPPTPTPTRTPSSSPSTSGPQQGLVDVTKAC